MLAEFRCPNIRAVCLAVLLTVAGGCGGGGGSSTSSTPPPQPPTPPKSLSGIVTLGPVANADIEILGTSGILATGTTATDGSFGPVAYDGDYVGPLRVRALGNAATSWVCDFYSGCYDGSDLYAFGESIPFDGVLEAVVPFADDDQFLSISFLSTLVSKRADALGPLSSATVDTAVSDIVAGLHKAIPGTLDAFMLEIPDDFSSQPLFDLGNLPDPDGENDDLQLILSVLNAALIGLNFADLSTGDFVDVFALRVAGEPELPIGSREVWEPSVENIAGQMIWIAADINSQSQDVIARYNALLAPASLNDLYGGAIFNFDFPTLNSQMADPVIDDPGSLPSGTLHFSVTGSDVGTLAAVNEFDAWVFGDGADDPPLLLTQPVSIDGENYLRVWPDADVVAQFPPGTYRQIINIYSTTGEYGRTQQIVNVDVTP